jgi:hypothetical protein
LSNSGNDFIVQWYRIHVEQGIHIRTLHVIHRLKVEEFRGDGINTVVLELWSLGYESRESTHLRVDINL